jgi:hypothetical protein
MDTPRRPCPEILVAGLEIPMFRFQASAHSRVKLVRAITMLPFLALPALAFPPCWILPGGGCAVTGTKSSQWPPLKGVVVHDRVRDFEIRNGAGALLYKGKLQDRVVLSETADTLHFYYRIRDTDPALAGDILAVDVTDFSDEGGMHADYRPDGLGTVGPSQVLRSPDGATIRFRFMPDVIDGGESSRFCFILTDAVEFEESGSVTIRLITGESTVLTAMAPVP